MHHQALPFTLAVSILGLVACANTVSDGTGGASATSGTSSTSSSTGGTGGTGGSGNATTCPAAVALTSEPNCEPYAVGLVCAAGDEPPLSCTCTSQGGMKRWACASAGTGGGGGGGPKADSIAMLDSALPAGTNTSSWAGAGETLDPTTLLVVFNTAGEACASPTFGGGTENHALLIVGLPVALQKPGSYAFSSTDVIAWGNTWLTDGMGNGGGGEFPVSMGTIDVVSIDASAVVAQLSGLQSDLSGLEGQHSAARCP